MLSVVFFLVKSYQLLVKHFEKDLYLCYEGNGNSMDVKACTRDKATDVNIENNKDESVFVKKTTGNKVLDVAGGGSDLIFYGFHGGFNQQFKLHLLGFNKFKIKYDKKCFEYQEDTNKYLAKNCQDNANQFFSLVDPEDEKNRKKEIENSCKLSENNSNNNSRHRRKRKKRHFHELSDYGSSSDDIISF